jgi:hypothetical protein
MANERSVRIERQNETRPDDSWMPQSSLPVPEPRDGWVFRWIRTSSLGRSDNTNVSRQFREGWEPVRAEDHPELKIMSDINSQFKGNVEVGGLLLCKAPLEKMKKRERHFQEVSDRQIEGVDHNYLRQNDPRMPLLEPERSTRSTFGRG